MLLDALGVLRGRLGRHADSLQQIHHQPVAGAHPRGSPSSHQVSAPTARRGGRSATTAPDEPDAGTSSFPKDMVAGTRLNMSPGSGGLNR